MSTLFLVEVVPTTQDAPTALTTLAQLDTRVRDAGAHLIEAQVAEGGARINDEVVTEPRLLSPDEVRAGLKLSAGRKRHALVRVE